MTVGEATVATGEFAWEHREEIAAGVTIVGATVVLVKTGGTAAPGVAPIYKNSLKAFGM
jgi:hypothetical protein